MSLVMEPAAAAALDEFVHSERGRFGDAAAQRIVLGLYRLIAAGKPVTADHLARDLGVDESHVKDVLDQLPSSWVQMDKRGITGFCGLGLEETRHRLTSEGNTLYGWCAFDGLFLPEVLDRPLDIETTCPATGSPIALIVAPERIERRDPNGLVMSFVTPGAEARRRNLRQVFCRSVNFFAAPEAAAAWQEQNPDALILDLDEAEALARRRNAAVFPDALAGRG